MKNLIYTLFCISIIALFVYSKLTHYKDRLTGSYLKIFSFCEKVFSPILSLLRNIAKPLQVGNGIAIDMSQIILLIILLLILKIV
jgi:uncharacterized protein YggT (Ycf19 family)